MKASQRYIIILTVSVIAVSNLTACQGNDTIGESRIVLNSDETVISKEGEESISENASISNVLSDTDFSDYIRSIYNDDNYVNQMYNYYMGADSGNTSDLDGDGVCDEIEYQLGTDPTTSDSDGDGISDLYELLLGLNPLENDVKLDLDGDGLSNIEEIKYGTNLNSTDTDNDGISDYDEIFVYKTDPLLSDTDGDGISDYDELQINLNPCTNMTDGTTLDNERIFYQTISQDITSTVSIYDYTLSVAVNASGYADNSISITSSAGFSSLKDGYTSIKGEVIDVDYDDTMTFTDVTLTFTLDDSLILDAPIDDDIYTQGVAAYQEWARAYTDVYLTSTLEGVKRYVIFEYDSQRCTLLPMNCTYDENANTITVRSENSNGTYCLVDLYDWLHNYCGMFDESTMTTSDSETDDTDEAE